MRLGQRFAGVDDTRRDRVDPDRGEFDRQRAGEDVDCAVSYATRRCRVIKRTVAGERTGFSAALITRPGNAPLPIHGLPQPNIVAADLDDLARQLGERSSSPDERHLGGDAIQ
jgi:hypothetical protein